MIEKSGCHAVTTRLQSAVRMGIIAVPLFYLAIAGKGTLGSSAFDTRFISDMLYPSTIEEADRQIDESGGICTPSLMQLLSRPDDYHGREVEVVGMAARKEDLAPDLLLYRFFISCCVADAMPISILVSGKQLSDIENGAWLRIRGRSETIEKNGKRLPKIQVSAVETIEKPKMPYLFY